MSKPTRNAWIMLAVSASVIATAFVIQGLRDDRSTDTLCMPQKEKGQTIVVLDKTDRWNPDQADRLVKHIENVLDMKMQPEERLRVFAFGASISPGFKERFTACKPPDGSDCRGILCNQEMLREQYRSKFKAPLREELETLKIATSGDCSPIAEALVEILSREEIRRQPGTTRLVLISDMAQNSPIYTAFRGYRSCPGSAALSHPDTDPGLLDHFKRYRSELRLAETSVTIYQISPNGRAPDVRDRARAKWDDVFKALALPAEWQRL